MVDLVRNLGKRASIPTRFLTILSLGCFCKATSKCKKGPAAPEGARPDFEECCRSAADLHLQDAEGSADSPFDRGLDNPTHHDQRANGIRLEREGPLLALHHPAAGYQLVMSGH